MIKLSILCILVLLSCFLTNSVKSAGIIADHTVVQEFSQIPSVTIQQIRNNFSIYYGHTSHGSQLVTGMDMLLAENPILIKPSLHEQYDDLGTTGDTTWVSDLRSQLNSGIYSVAIMSWCGGVSDITEAGIDLYLTKMNQLELDYPGVTFIYMTGHLDGTGPTGNLYIRNNQIRAYCEANNKYLYDFADIESYDPDGVYYPNESDACTWCYTWCSVEDCPTCGSCAHSHCFNCYQKGKAFWWLLARITGWNLTLDTNDQTEPQLPEYFRLDQNYPNPFNLSTSIRFELPTSSHVQITVYNVIGQKIITLIDETLPAGEQLISWDGLDENNKEIASGIYYYRLETQQFQNSKTMVLIK